MKEENKPFNDVIEHFDTIEGNVGTVRKDDLKRVPKPLKYFGYFIFAFFAISILLMVILNLLN
ncbi:amino acid transporter [Bacillus sp. ISL-77]|uniref:amino acid transporter n=1 Tax=Bacillus sp. ISL-77 TaxID=2819138 RepID=UPI001BE767F0|nr:amino acid transporter [Bacillus sp. ISL-77]MBT2743333.1 amino acid transporter [Bacillus sp. ISL-77]